MEKELFDNETTQQIREIQNGILVEMKETQAENEKTIWQKLSRIDCSGHTENKQGLTYLSWAWAIGIVSEIFPNWSYNIREWDSKPYLYDEQLGYMCVTSVTIEGVTKTMWLPVMDYNNKAMKAESYEIISKYYDKTSKEWKEKVTKINAATMFDINTTIMRCLVKNLAMFGLGHYIYAGEDLPKDEQYSIKEKDHKGEVFDYLINNGNALEYYNKIYQFGNIDNLTTEQINKIYKHLKDHHRI